jgi:hypothetical protein
VTGGRQNIKQEYDRIVGRVRAGFRRIIAEGWTGGLQNIGQEDGTKLCSRIQNVCTY